LATWEEMNQDSIRKPIRVLELIIQTVNEFSQTKCAIVHVGDGVPKIYSIKDVGGICVLRDLLKMWKQRRD
jgi:hypothetical protein